MAVDTQIFYTQDGTLPEDLSLWQLSVEPEANGLETIPGLAAGLYYVKLRNTDGVNYSPFSDVYTVTISDPPPAAPTVTADDTANWLDFAHALGDAEILVSENAGAYVAMTSLVGWNATSGRIDVGDVARAAGYWQAKTKATATRPESAVANSPAFTVANTAPTVAAPIADQTKTAGYGSFTVDLTGVFADAEGDALTYTASSSNTALATVSVNNTTKVLTVTEVSGTGSVNITVTADDGKGGTVSDVFALQVNAATPSVIVYQDNYGDNVIGSEYEVANGDPTKVIIEESGALQFTMKANQKSTGNTNTVKLPLPTRTGAGAVSVQIDKGGNQSLHSFGFYIISTSGQGYALITRDSADALATLNARLLVSNGTSTVYNVAIPGAEAFNLKRWKITYDPVTYAIKFWRWLNGAWTQTGDTVTQDIGPEHYVFYRGDAYDTASADLIVRFDDLYITNADYATEIPV